MITGRFVKDEELLERFPVEELTRATIETTKQILTGLWPEDKWIAVGDYTDLNLCNYDDELSATLYPVEGG
jgi:hypothetical protein